MSFYIVETFIRIGEITRSCIFSLGKNHEISVARGLKSLRDSTIASSNLIPWKFNHKQALPIINGSYHNKLTSGALSASPVLHGHWKCPS